MGWIVAGSLATGLIAALLLVAAPFVPAEEDAVTGAVLRPLLACGAVVRGPYRGSTRPQTIKQLIDRLGDDHVDRRLFDHATAGHRSEPLERRERKEGESPRIARAELARGLRLDEDGQRRGQCAVRRLTNAMRVGPLLGGEHELEQGGVLGGERDVGLPERMNSSVEGVTGTGHRPRERVAEAFEAVLRERVDQRLAVGEVAVRCGVADADLTGETAQR